MVIGVDDAVAVAGLGDRLAYTISVRNEGHAASGRLTIALTPPTGVELARVDGGGTVKGGIAHWTVAVAASKSATLTAEARVTEVPEGVKGLAAVACVTEGGVPKLCATDIDQIPGRPDIHAATAAAKNDRSRPDWVHWVAGSSLALVALAIVAVLIRKRRRPTS